MRLWLSLLAALLLTSVALGFTIFVARSTLVGCTRAGSHVSCAESEAIRPY
jgi:hypothetical protein